VSVCLCVFVCLCVCVCVCADVRKRAHLLLFLSRLSIPKSSNFLADVSKPQVWVFRPHFLTDAIIASVKKDVKKKDVIVERGSGREGGERRSHWPGG
jgi:hypothetical protein